MTNTQQGQGGNTPFGNVGVGRGGPSTTHGPGEQVSYCVKTTVFSELTEYCRDSAGSAQTHFKRRVGRQGGAKGTLLKTASDRCSE
jgi:hypothetical protein